MNHPDRLARRLRRANGGAPVTRASARRLLDRIAAQRKRLLDRPPGQSLKEQIREIEEQLAAVGR